MFSWLNKIGKPQNDKNEEKKPDYKKIQDERRKIKKEIEKALKDLYFTSDQIKEVLAIVDNAQDKIQILKDNLIGTNIDQIPVAIEKKTMAKIDLLTKQMNKDLETKVKDIMFRRKLM